jgi:hypothetical protein
VNQLFRTKSIDALIAASEEPDRRLRKTLGPWSLTALGVGAVIGSGIFTLTGTAAAGHVEKINSVLNATVLDLLTSGLHAGCPMGRPGARLSPIVFAGGHRLPFAGVCLCRTGVDDPHRRRASVPVRHSGARSGPGSSGGT